MFQSTCQHFNTWLRVAREKLATCSDTYGDKITVQSKMDKIKVSGTDEVVIPCVIMRYYLSHFCLKRFQ